MKTVVTGGSGLIGSHLVRQLTQQGRDVVVLDDFSRGKPQNLTDLGVQQTPRQVDLRDYAQTVRALAGADSVFHLAARVGSVEMLHGGELAELLALQTNLVIDANVFRGCLENRVKKLVYASSVSVYPIDHQNTAGVVFKEEDMPYLNPEGGYGWAKLMGEIELKWMAGLDIGIARIFNVYGEGESPDADAHVIPALMRKVALYPDEGLAVWGDGSQTRDLLYVEDAVEALLRLEEKVAAPPVVVNIGSGDTVTVRELVNIIIKVSGKRIEPTFDPSRPVGPRSRTADITRAKQLLGWEPKVTLEDGLSRTYNWVALRLGRPA